MFDAYHTTIENGRLVARPVRYKYTVDVGDLSQNDIEVVIRLFPEKFKQALDSMEELTDYKDRVE